MDRQKVYELINGERQYQEDLPQHQDKIQQQNTPVASWIIYMKHLLCKAEEQIYFMNVKGALEYVRKCTAVGIACMEHNETPERVNPYRKENNV